MQIVLGMVLTVVSLYQVAEFVNKASADVAPQRVYGVWSVDEMVEDGQSRPPLITDSQRWQALVFDHAKWLVVQQMNGQQLIYRMEVDPMDRTLKLAEENSKVWQSQLEFASPQPDLLTLKGEMDGHQIEAKLRRVDLTDSKFLLKNRGFHWINEHPLVQ